MSVIIAVWLAPWVIGACRLRRLGIPARGYVVPDTPERRIAWHALSELFLDLRLSEKRIAAMLATTSFTERELEVTYFAEIAPAFATRTFPRDAEQWHSFADQSFNIHLAGKQVSARNVGVAAMTLGCIDEPGFREVLSELAALRAA